MAAFPTTPPATLPAPAPQDSLILRLDSAARLFLAQYHTDEHALLPELQTLCLPVVTLWSRLLRYDPATPDWPDRDRFVVPSASMLPLLHAMLHLSAPTPPPQTLGYGQHPAVEIAPGPAGQGIAAAAGMALAEQVMATRHGRSLVNHRTWVLARDTDLQTGVALEAAQLAGRFGLNRLAVLVSPAPTTDPAEFADSLARFSASGWSVRSVGAGNLAAITTALTATLRARKPTLVAFLPEDTPHPTAAPPEEELTGPWSPTARRGASVRRSWLRRLARHRGRYSFERECSGAPPPLLAEDWLRLWRQTLQHQPTHSSQQAAMAGLAALAATRPELTVLTATSGARSAPAHADQPDWPCGLQEHGMAGMLNGMALHGGLLPCAVAGMITIDRMRAALRMTALMRRKVLYLLTDDGLALSGNGGGWQPVEQLASLRAMPNLAVFRPGCAEETFACWQAALRWNGPALLVLCPHDTPDTPTPPPGRFGSATHGGYLLHGGPQRQVTLVSSGPEVTIALAAARALEETGIRTAVAALPCWEVFATQPEAYRTAVLGETGLRVGIEAASGFGWERWLGPNGIFIGMDDFGVSAPASAVYERFGITTGAICSRVINHLAASGGNEAIPVHAPVLT